MSVRRPTSYAGDGGTGTPWLRHGGTTIDGVVADLDDATWDFAGGAGTLWGALFGVATIDHTVSPTTFWCNIKMRRIAVPDTGFTSGTTLYLIPFADDGSTIAASPLFDVSALLNSEPSGGAFKWYSVQCSGTWQSPGGGTANTIFLRFFGGALNAAEIDIAEVSFGDNEAIQNFPQAGAASVTMAATSTQGYSSGGGSTLHTVVGTGTIVTVNPNTVNFVPGQGQTVGHVIIDGTDEGEIFTFTFSDDAADHIITVTFVPAQSGSTSYTYGLIPGSGMNREDIGGPHPVESHPENNAANQPGPRGFVPQIRHFVPFPKDFI